MVHLKKNVYSIMPIKSLNYSVVNKIDSLTYHFHNFFGDDLLI
jgi:hypothetical protein